jgi:hypothetical protein
MDEFPIISRPPWFQILQKTATGLNARALYGQSKLGCQVSPSPGWGIRSFAYSAANSTPSIFHKGRLRLRRASERWAPRQLDCGVSLTPDRCEIRCSVWGVTSTRPGTPHLESNRGPGRAGQHTSFVTSDAPRGLRALSTSKSVRAARSETRENWRIRASGV